MFISACSLPFRFIECSEFQALLLFLGGGVDIWQPDTHKTIKKGIMQPFDAEKPTLKQGIQSANSIIQIGRDIGTSLNCLAMISLTNLFNNKNNKN
jgi:hypothetical protein